VHQESTSDSEDNPERSLELFTLVLHEKGADETYEILILEF